MSELYIPPERPERNLVNGQFLKGCTPHNKGKRMTYHSKWTKRRSLQGLVKGRGAHHKTGADMKQTTTSEFKYWLRIHGIQLKWLGTGTKNNPIKIKSKKRNK